MKRLADMTEPELRDLMNAMGKQIEMTARHKKVEKPMFVLLLFNDPAVAQYMSNCEREGCIAALREAAERLERKEDVPR